MKQSIYEQSATPKYPIGTRIALGDMVFRYCYAEEALNALYGAFNKGEIYASGGAIEKHTKGSTLVNLDCVGVVAKDELANGCLCDIYSHFICRIKSNLATDTGIIAITLKDPLPVEIPKSDPAAKAAGDPPGFECHHVRAHYNKYSHIVHWAGDVNENYRAVVCVPLIDITAEHYYWGQTWGECLIRGENCAYFENIGRTALKREIAFCYRGGPVYRGGAETVDAFQQRAGYLLSNGNTGSSAAGYEANTTPDGDNLIMLQLAP